MKKRILILSILLVFVFAIGCSNSKPDDTVEKYFTAAQKLDFESMIATIIPLETKFVDEVKDSFTGEENNYPKYFIDYLKRNAEKITYKITDSKVEGDNAVVTVETKYINGGPIIKASLGELFTKGIAMSFSGVEMTDEETNQIFDSIIKKQVETIEETYIEANIEVNCVKKEGVWYISEINNELLDVPMSGIISSLEEINKFFGEGVEE